MNEAVTAAGPWGAGRRRVFEGGSSRGVRGALPAEDVRADGSRAEGSRVEGSRPDSAAHAHLASWLGEQFIQAAMFWMAGGPADGEEGEPPGAVARRDDGGIGGPVLAQGPAA